MDKNHGYVFIHLKSCHVFFLFSRDLISARSKNKECLVESNSHSAENIAKLSGKVNKKNFKGMFMGMRF